jgi:guanine deaminase
MSTTGDLRRIFKGFVMNPLAHDRVDSYDPGYLVVAENKIEKLTRTDPRPEYPSAEFIDHGRNTIVPGFVDTHVHLPQFAIMGLGTGELLQWLNDYTYPEEARFVDSVYAAQISELFFDALIANGTTAAVIYSSVHEGATDIAFSTAQRKRIRAFIGKVMMDRNSAAALVEATAASIAQSLRLFEKWDGAEDGRLRYIFTPRYAGSCSMELMQRVGKLARERGAFVQSHLSENKEEIEWVRSLFPGAPSYAAIYDSAGLLHERCIMAHCIHLTSDEIALLRRTSTKIAYCPYSNRNLHSGTMPYHKLSDAGLNISLGTDVAGGPSLSMLDQMREARAAAHISRDEALYLATLAGAKALGLQDRIGNFAAGKDADFVILEKDSVREVYVRGELVYVNSHTL